MRNDERKGKAVPDMKMSILVYGSGVIGCYLAHVLCSAGNDVTLLARGQWKEQLQRNGLRIRHHLQRKTTLDHPRVIGGIEEKNPMTQCLPSCRTAKCGRSLNRWQPFVLRLWCW